MEGTFKNHFVQLCASVLIESHNIFLRVLYKCLLNTHRHGTSATSIQSLYQCLTAVIVKQLFLMSSPDVALCHCQLDTCSWGTEHSTSLFFPLLCREQWGHLLVPPEWAIQTSSASPYRTCLQPCYQFCGFSLDVFKYLNVLFVLWSPEQCTILKISLYQS